MDDEQTSLGAEQLLGFLRRRALWIAGCIVLLAGVAYGYSRHETKKYTATAALGFNSNQLAQQIAGLPSGGTTINLLAEQNSNREFVRLGESASRTAALVGSGLTAEKVKASVSVSGQSESSVVNISAVSASPKLAAAIANTYASQFVKDQQGSNRQFFRSALALVRRQLRELPASQRFGSDGLDLQQRAHTLDLLAELGYNEAQIAQRAVVPSRPSSPRTKRNTIIGAILGLLLGLGVAALIERFDHRIRSAEELETIYGLAAFGAVPKSDALRGKAALPSAEAEAFSLIRAHLRFFNLDHEVRTAVIASPAPGDGKTTIARHLAEAAARSGARVLLLEADLRSPTLARHLDLMPGPGLADVLIGAVPIGEATRSVDLAAASGEGALGCAMDVLPAGVALPPNPAELVESRAMGNVLDWARWSEYDLVVIDTPPLDTVSDAFPLLSKVDGIVVVGRIGHSRRDAAERLHQAFVASQVPVLGVIANGSKSGAPSPYLSGHMSPPSARPAGNASAPGGLVRTPET